MRHLTHAAALLALALGAPAAAAPPAAQRTVVVTLRGEADLRTLHRLARPERRREVVRALQGHARAGQARVGALLRGRQAAGRVSRLAPLWVVNAISVTAAEEVIRELAAHPDVLAIADDAVDVIPVAVPAGPPEPNLLRVAAPDLWSLGFLGQGVVVATMDSGVDATHPDLSARWRSGPGGWFDPYGQHPAGPVDLAGHGTWTMGALLGGDAGGTSIGVAPGATWIAARIFDDAGRATATAIHQAFQWMLDPDGNPATDDAPDVVNGSWSYGYPGCNLAFQPDVRALLAAGILPVFAAGNFGPGAGSSVSPANYPESLAVGAVDLDGQVASDSGRGPSACGAPVFPTVVAPGVAILTADRLGGYASVSGTSIAAPHLAGTLALLRGAFPAAPAADLVTAVARSARDLGPAGPDGDHGHGQVDALGAYLWLAAQPPPPPPAPPVAAADAYALAQDTSATFTAPGVLANDTSPSGRPLAAVLVSGAAHGQVALQPSGAFSYTPAPGYFGADAFSYAASDGTLASAPASVALTVNRVNRPPLAANDAAATSRNVAVTVNLVANDSDPDGVVVATTLAVVAGPASGRVANRGNGTVTYTPNRGFRGTDAFSYTVKDDAGATSNVATVSVRVR